MKMQDSLADYIKFSKSTQKDEIPISKEERVTALVKKECDMRAMKIVELSIEGKVRPEVFTRCLPYINQSHYQDIVEERAISKLCGYSLCGKRLPDMPKKQYFISTKSNKVYDITDRKNYCSNFCYKASLHIKKQVDNSPLWLRKLEDIPEYNLLHPTAGGLPGEYIDQGVVKPAKEPAFTSVSSFTEVSLDEMMRGTSGNKEKKPKSKDCRKRSKLKSYLQTINENEVEVVEDDSCESKNEKRKPKKSEVSSKKSNVVSLPAIDETVEIEKVEECVNKQLEIKSEKGMNNEINTVKAAEGKTVDKQQVPRKSKKKVTKPQTPKVDVESHLKKCLKEWITLESLIFVHGKAKMKEILSAKKLESCFESLKITELHVDQQIKYMNICKRLHLQELAEEKFDRNLVGNPKLRPLPDYKKLKEESKELEIKVKAFLTGGVYEKEEPVRKTEETVEEGPPSVMPLVDVNSQNALRRKIFLNSLSKVMQQLLQELRFTSHTSILSDLQTLVKTFKLKSDNIVFKPPIWNCIAVILLHMLSLRDGNVKDILEEKRSQEHISLLLCSIPNKVKFIEDVMEIINDVDSFVENHVMTKEM